MKLRCLVVSVRVGRNKAGVTQLHESVFGPIADHGVRVRHAHHPGIAQLAKHLEVARLSSRNRSRIDPAHISICRGRHFVENRRSVGVAVKNHFSRPTLRNKGVDHRHGVLAVPIRAFIGSTFSLEEDNVLFHRIGPVSISDGPDVSNRLVFEDFEPAFYALYPTRNHAATGFTWNSSYFGSEENLS